MNLYGKKKTDQRTHEIAKKRNIPHVESNFNVINVTLLNLINKFKKIQSKFQKIIS